MTKLYKVIGGFCTAAEDEGHHWIPLGHIVFRVDDKICEDSFNPSYLVCEQHGKIQQTILVDCLEEII